jgi:CRP/FNR family transcriptional regulator, cyclic AMP receptor protein
MEFIKELPYFKGLSDADLATIRKMIVERSVERSEIIQLDGEIPVAIFFVVSGAVKIFKTSEDGKEQILNILRPGDSFNDVPVFDGGVTPASAQAMGPVVLYELNKNAVETVLLRYPQVSRNVINVLAGRVRTLISLVEDLSFKSVIGRVAKILLEHMVDGQGPAPKLTQQEMAGIAGTAREVVGRSLKALEETGAIRLDRHRIVIKNKQILKEMAGSNL